MGGGSKNFIPTSQKLHDQFGTRTDRKNLINEWLSKGNKNKRKFVQNRSELLAVDSKKIDKLLGIFHSDHLPYNLEMTMKAIEMLTNDVNGYFLLVEGGR